MLRTGLPGDVPVFCQPEDGETLHSSGLADVRPVTDGLFWKGIDLYRTGGQHGTGNIGVQMAPVSGFVLQSGPEESILYVVGETI